MNAPGRRLMAELDVEGGELDVLKGATRLLQRPPRPVILCEVQDVRTRPWGYPAREIVSFMHGLAYQWFRLRPDGGPEALPPGQTEFFANLLAVPGERIEPMSKTGLGV